MKFSGGISSKYISVARFSGFRCERTELCGFGGNLEIFREISDELCEDF